MGAPVELRFADFEVSLRSGELRRNGVKVKLQEQPFQILVLLLECHGEVVTREAIRYKLWTTDTFVDFDNGLNIAVKKLRIALGDDADAPAYIETLPRRGYRFITPVIRTQDAAAEANGLVGKKVSHYRVLEVIGGGGMGLVYKAEDLKLGRRVALKFLPEELATDSITLQRFDREARTASSLNHPHICTIYEVEEYEGQPFIVMELLEGETLRDRLAAREGALGPEEMLDIALQVTDGLVAAHEQGIIHRDIKPANVFITSEGVCKILDFGIAKLLVEVPGGVVVEVPESARVERGFSAASQAYSPLPSGPEGPAYHPAPLTHAALTLTGSAMGTAGYMSPEQVRGEKLDARTDIFSFGLVLYEMASGQRAFSGETAAVVHEAIVNDTPVPVRELNPTLPAKLLSVIDKALEKDRQQRYQSAAEMRADLQAVRQDTESRHRSAPVSATSRRLKTPPTRTKKLLRIAVPILLVTALAGGGLYYRSRQATRLTEKDTIVLADFDNQTSDPVFDEALNTALRIGLEQTPFLNVLTADKVRGTLKLLKHPEDAELTQELAREVCLRTKSNAVIAGSIADAGNRFRIELRSINCQTGKTFAQSQEDTGDRSDVVRVLGIAGGQLRSKLGEPEASLRKFSKPLQEATSSSLEALRFLTEGIRRHASMDMHGAIPYYNRAIEIDPNLALAYVYRGTAYANLDEVTLAEENEKKAYELRDRLTQRSRFYAEATYYSFGTWELEKGCQVHMQWLQAFPTDVIAHIDLSRCLYYLGEQYERAAAEAREAIRLMPTALTYLNLMDQTLVMDRPDESKGVFDEAQARNILDSHLRAERYLVGFVQQDQMTMRDQLAWAKGKIGVEDSFLSLEADTEAYYGRFRSARRLSQQVVDLAGKAGPSNLTLTYRAAGALREAEVGNSVQARQAIADVTESEDRDRSLEAALIFARIGDVKQAEKLVERVNQEFPLDTLTQNYCLPTIRAAMKLHQNDPAGAIKVLQPAVRYELAHPDAFNNLYPTYVRGLAYLQAGDGRSAAPEFQRVLDHPGIVRNFIIGALAYLQLGRAQAMMGDQEAARKSYQDFLTLWKDADRDIPIYRQAKAEYAKLM